MNTKKYVLMATIPQREQALKKVLDSLYDQVDEIRIVFNNYPLIPDWIKIRSKIVPLLNTPDEYTSSSIWLMMNGIDGYLFTTDDDIIYPKDYVQSMLKKLNEYKNKVVVSMYGETINWPVTGYKNGRKGFGFLEEWKEDRVVEIAGIGCSLFHTDLLRPKISDFPDKFSRDLWFAVLAAKNQIKIIRVKSCKSWLGKCGSGGPEIKHIWRSDPKLVARREEVFMKILIPLLRKMGRG